MKSSRSLYRFIFPLTAASLLAGGGSARADLPSPAIENPSALRVVNPSSHKDLHAIFSSEGYDWTTLDKGVPPIILNTLPSDLGRVPRLSERKNLFFLSLLPMVLMANDEISRKREDLLAVFDQWNRGENSSREVQDFVISIAREYNVEKDPFVDLAARETLLKRVDIVPPSLVLAQAANESGYGTSRFALKGNNLFGEWTFNSGSGLVPRERPLGETYEVRRFPSLFDSVRAYLKNINTHVAYVPLRERRATLRAEGLPLQGPELAKGLTKYSVRGEAYVKEIRDIIRRNRLSLLASVTLRQEVPSDSSSPGSGLFSSGYNASRRVQLASQGREPTPLPFISNQTSFTLLRK